MSHTSRPKSDASLVCAARAGETAAFASLVERHFGLVHFIALARLSDAEAAEDLAQEVFLRAFVSLGSLQRPERFPAWLAQITRNLAVNWLRQNQRRSALVPLVPLESVAETAADAQTKGGRERMEAQEQSDALRRALAGFPPDLREMVLLHFAENLTQHEIAKRLGLNQATVSRRIQRALSAMRGMLEPILREGAPRLRPAREATVKAVALITVAGAMSATAKASLAASVAASGGVATSGKVGGAIGLLGLIQSIPALVAGGGAVMGAGKGIAAVVAVAAVAGGAYVYTSGGADSGSSGAASPDVTTQAEPQDWSSVAREFARSRPGNEGLLHVVDALEQFQLSPRDPQIQAIGAIVEEGWRFEALGVEAALRSQAPALEAAIAAAEAESIEFPPMERLDSPLPNMLNVQVLMKLLLADARRLEAAGQMDRAAERSLQAARFSEHLCVENVALIQHLVGVACLRLSLECLEDIITQPGLSQEALREIRADLERIDQNHIGLATAFRAESQMLLNQLRAVAEGDTAALDEAGLNEEVRRDFERAAGRLDSYEPEHRRIWDAIIADLERPSWERMTDPRGWLNQQNVPPLLQSTIPNHRDAGLRGDVTIAHLRICLVLCDLRLNDIAAAQGRLDPFSGRPLLVGADRVWSIGPDLSDQGGNRVYDSRNGEPSLGDIVVAR
jgi:RNA polymerase sigma-70 factor, ECF subfamily